MPSFGPRLCWMNLAMAAQSRPGPARMAAALVAIGAAAVSVAAGGAWCVERRSGRDGRHRDGAAPPRPRHGLRHDRRPDEAERHGRRRPIRRELTPGPLARECCRTDGRAYHDTRPCGARAKPAFAWRRHPRKRNEPFRLGHVSADTRAAADRGGSEAKAIIMTKRVALLAGILALLSAPVAADAQGIVAGARSGTATGERAAGPVGGVVGGVVGGAVGGVVGGVRGVFGLPRGPARRVVVRHRRRHRP